MKRVYGDFFAGTIGGIAFVGFLALMALAAIMDG